MAASKLISSFGSRGDATKVFCRPASIIIDKYAHSSKHMNKDTMATAKSRDGHILEVSLTIHQPPALSYFCVDCHRPPNYKPDAAYLGESLHMVAAEGCFLLLRGFFSSSGEEEYFMYKAGNGDSGKLASLERLPLPRAYCLPNLREFGIVPRHDGHYLLAGLAMGFIEPSFYRLHLYSSEDKKWEDIKLKNPCPQLGRVITNKVVTLDEGIIGWVDFLHGMLVCNMLETDLTARYIPLPDLLPENKDTVEELHPAPFATRFRDLTCINGLIELIEMEHYFQNPAFHIANGKVLDSDLIKSRTCKVVSPSQTWMGWKAVIWSRTLSSDGWEMGLVLDAADIVFDNSKDLSLLSGLKGFSDTEKIVFKDLYSAYPTLSADGDDILYLKTWKNLNDLDGRLVALDLRSKSVKAVVDYTLAKHSPLVKAFGLCTVPSVTTGNASARDLNNTSICVGHPSSCESNRKRPRQVGDYTLAKHSPLVKAFRLCTVPPVTTGNASARDPNNTSICVGHPSSCESNSKRPRLLAEKVNHGDQNIVQNDHISLVPLVENKLPPLQRFIKHYTPFYSHQNNQASQPCFNYFGGTSYHGYSQQLPAPTTFVEGQSSEKCDGSRDIGYAPPCPPQLPDYSKYHPLWQHSQPMTYSSVIGPYKVSQPCFSYCEGASHDGHSRQIPAPTSFAEGQYPDRWAGSGGLGPWLSAPTCPQPQFPEYSNNYQPLRQHSQPSEERVIHSSTFGPWEAPQCV